MQFLGKGVGCIFICMLIPFVSKAQNVDSTQRNIFLYQADSMIGEARKNLDTGKPKLAFELANKALIIYRNNLDSVSYPIANAYSYLGLCNNDFGNYDLAIEQLTIAEKIWAKIYGEEHNYVGDANHYLGGSYMRKGQFDEAMRRFKSAYRIRLAKFGKKSNLTAGSAQNTGIVFYQKGMLDSAEYYMNEALRIREALYPEGNLNLANTYMNFGAMLIQKKNYENALYYLERSKYLYELLAPEHQNLKGVIANLGVIAFYLNDYRKAIGYNELILKQIGASTEKKFEMSRITAMLNLSVCFKNLDELDIAEKYLNESYALALKYYNGKTPEILEMLSEFGHLKQRRGDFQGAKDAYRSAYDVTQSFGDTTSFNYLNILQNLGDMYRELKQDSAAFCYKKYWSTIANSGDQSSNFTGKTKYLRYIFEHGDVDTCLNIIEKEENLLAISGDAIKTDSYKSYLKYLKYMIQRDKKSAGESFESSFKIYRDNFNKRQTELSANNRKILADDANYDREICLKLLSDNDLGFSDSLKQEIAWYLIESSKSVQLNLNLGLQSLLGINSDLDYLVLKCFTLKSNISDYEKAYKDAVRNLLKSDQQQVTAISDNINQTQNDLDETVGRIEKSYPEFYKRIFKENISSVHEIKSSLKRDECIVNYYLTDTVIYSIVSNADTIVFCHQNFNKADIFSAISAINQPNFSESENTMFRKLNKAYLVLIKPVKSLLKPRIKIVPSGILHSLPFESLVTEKRTGNQVSYSYLLDKYEFTYSFTGKPNQKTQAASVSSGFVFSPFSTPPSLHAISDKDNFRGEAYPLVYSLKEAKVVSTLTKSKHFDNKAATLKNFYSIAPKAGILHLATHARSNSNEVNDACILFSDTATQNKLWVSQLEKMLIPSKMVVLSACETNAGKIISGEGVFSLSRGFMLAGAHSVISSFWKINDVSATNLIIDFYKIFVSGQTSGQALTKAKRNYLKQAKGRFQHPYYWSAFVLHGDANLLYNP